MSRFVSAFGNSIVGHPLVNLDHVATLKANMSQGKIQSYECYAVDGERLGTVSTVYAKEDLDTVVPNVMTGLELVIFYLDGEKVDSFRLPIVAWRVESGGSAMPVSYEDIDGDTWCICNNDGEHRFPELAASLTEDEAISHAKELLFK